MKTIIAVAVFLALIALGRYSTVAGTDNHFMITDRWTGSVSYDCSGGNCRTINP